MEDETLVCVSAGVRTSHAVVTRLDGFQQFCEKKTLTSVCEEGVVETIFVGGAVIVTAVSRGHVRYQIQDIIIYSSSVRKLTAAGSRFGKAIHTWFLMDRMIAMIKT